MVTVAPNPIALPRAEASVPRLAYIEGLRALAALWVMLSHMWISQCGRWAHTGPLGLATNWLLYSHLAVDVFIVLSGYCLFLPVQRDGGHLRAGPQGFWRRRARRILPPMYFALAFAVAISVLLERLDGQPWQRDVRALVVNLLLLQDLILRDNVFNSPLWSVAVEWRLSLVFPILAWGLRRVGRPIVLLAAGAVGYSLTALIWDKAPLLFLSCPWYLLLFTLGMCAASAASGPDALSLTGRLQKRPWWRLGVLVSLILLIVLLRAFPVTTPNENLFGPHMPLIDAAAGVLTALVLVGLRRAVHTTNALAPRLLSWPPLDALGRFSYSLYLTHEPLIRLLTRLMKFSPALSAASPLMRFGLLVGVGTPLLITMAYLFFLGCERPFMTSLRARRNTPETALALS